MTQLRQRMIEDMQLRGLSETTQTTYVGAVKQLAEHYGKSPDLISQEELCQYFLYLKNDKQASRSAYKVALYGIRFFYNHTLKHKEIEVDWTLPPRPKKLPVVLSTDEVRRILACLHRQHYRVCLPALAVRPGATIYSCGSR